MSTTALPSRNMGLVIRTAARTARRLPPSSSRAIAANPSVSRCALHTSSVSGVRSSPVRLRSSLLSTSFTTAPSSTPQPGKPRVRTIFWATIVVAFGALGIGLTTFYTSYSTWPAEVRGPLRSAVKAHRASDWSRAEKYYREALEAARTLPLEKLGDDALFKLSGISIALGALLEQSGHLRKAYDVYQDAFDEVQAQARTPAERLKAVALSQRCGDLAGVREVRDSFSLRPIEGQETSRAERHLRWSVEELLRLTIPEETRQRVLEGRQDAVYVSDLDLPADLSATTLGAALEALGQLYAAHGRAEYAVPLYLQAINVLMPSDPAKRKQDPTVADRCRAGILMNNVAHLLVDARENEAQPKVEDAHAWAMRGLDIVSFALRGTGWDGKGGPGFKAVVDNGDEQRTNEVKAQCWTAEVALLINLGELSRLRKDKCKAREYFQRGYVKAETYGMREARARCAQALSELERVRG